ncbi:hypothetical protein FHR71_002482 [Methylobacterium sp. RAS18]|nr:hypothetical protein [Methylobacterium sp. RAS18]
MAVWCSLKGQAPDTSLETHLNYWRVAGLKRKKCKPHKEDFLEIGLLIKNPNPVEKLNIFVPFDLDRSKIDDLGGRFDQSDLAQGIFNEKLASRNRGAAQSWLDLEKSSTDIFCRVHIFSKNNELIDSSELNVAAEHGGTIITISRLAIERSSRGLANDLPLYFRLRILGGSKKGGPFVKVITPIDHPFQSGFDEIEYIDFRLNESRTLPIGIERKIADDALVGTVPVSMVAFLTAVPVLAELSVSHTTFHKNRLLEEAPWNTYAPFPLPPGMMVYHWKKNNSKAPIDDFTAFVKLQTRKTSKRIIASYLGIAFGFGVLGNLAAPWLQKFFPWLDATEKNAISLDATNFSNPQHNVYSGPPSGFIRMPAPTMPKPGN